MTPRFIVEPLASKHDRAGFESGVEPLDRYLQTQAGQDIRRRVSSCFVVVDVETGRLIAYYTLAMSAVLISELPEKIAKRMPRYPTVPAARLGRLAVDARRRGEGLGAALLWDAEERAIRAEIAAYALLVDAKDETAAAFYRHHGFVELSGHERMLFLPLGHRGPARTPR